MHFKYALFCIRFAVRLWFIKKEGYVCVVCHKKDMAFIIKTCNLTKNYENLI